MTKTASHSLIYTKISSSSTAKRTGINPVVQVPACGSLTGHLEWRWATGVRWQESAKMGV